MSRRATVPAAIALLLSLALAASARSGVDVQDTALNR